MTTTSIQRRVEDLSTVLELHDEDLKRPWVLTDAIVDSPPELALSIDGAATLTVTVHDEQRRLLRDRVTRRRLWADVPGPWKLPVRFEYVRLRKSGNRLTLEFEDGIIAALRREKASRAFAAGTASRAEIIRALAREAEVRHTIDMSRDKPVPRAVERSAAGEKTDTLTVIRELAEERQWRAFSDGNQLIVGPDSWLIERDTNPTLMREYTGAVHEIDFDLDVGKRASTATVNVDAERWALPPGSVVRVHDEMGPASGRWLVSEFRRPLTSRRGTVTLIRKRHELDEPKASSGDRGNPSYSPRDPGEPGAVPTSSSARERMVRFALAQSGKPYVWGASGPAAFDCSGLVQEASRQGGATLPKPAASQWAVCVQRGKTMGVDQALRTRGALVFRIGGSFNHVAISLGNGSTVEAMGSAYGCGVFGGAASRGWTGAALWL